MGEPEGATSWASEREVGGAGDRGGPLGVRQGELFPVWLCGGLADPQRPSPSSAASMGTA